MIYMLYMYWENLSHSIQKLSLNMSPFFQYVYICFSLHKVFRIQGVQSHSDPCMSFRYPMKSPPPSAHNLKPNSDNQCDHMTSLHWTRLQWLVQIQRTPSERSPAKIVETTCDKKIGSNIFVADKFCKKTVHIIQGFQI